MTKPVRLQLSRAKGFDLQATSRAVNGLPAISVARPGPWGNPFVVGRDGTQQQCVDLYAHLLLGNVVLRPGLDMATLKAAHDHVRAYSAELAGHNLACWCRLGTPCHADLLLAVVKEDADDLACEEALIG